MKALKSLSIITGIVILASCSEEFDLMKIENPTPSGTVFHAYSDNENETRTELAENDGSQVYWSPEESITVFDAEGDNRKFVSTNCESSPSVDFVLENNVIPISEPNPGEYFYALYPYDSNATLEDGIIHTSFPSTFEVERHGSFGDNMNLTIARSTSYSLSFKNLLAWLRVGFTGDEVVTKIVFKGNNGEKLAGNVSIDVAGLTATVEEEGSGEQLVLTGQFKASESKENGRYYYIPLLSLSFEKGITITFYKDDGTTYTYVNSSSLSFNRGKKRRLWIDLATLTKQYTYTRVVTPSGADKPTFNDGDEYIVVYPTGNGSYNVFAPQKLLKNIEDFRWNVIGLTDFLTDDDKRYGAVGTMIFNNDYITVTGNDELITVDSRIGVQVNSKSATIENNTASFPKSHQRPVGMGMTINDISLFKWNSNSSSSLAKGTLDDNDVYVLCDQMLSRHSEYFNTTGGLFGITKWTIAFGSTDESLKNKIAQQYNGDYGITAGYVSSEYNGTHYEGFAFKDNLLFNPAVGLQSVYIYRRTPASE